MYKSSFEPEPLDARVERALDEVLGRAVRASTPPRLGAALRYAIFPGGARLRPQLTLAVARACGEKRPVLAEMSAVAVELVHCASLVHDDMPCFDDATARRGKATVHRKFDEATALLVGDALIVLAFEALGRVRASESLVLLAEAMGPTRGLIAGQAWESEGGVLLAEYHRAKTAALFDAAAGMGAIACGVDAAPWRVLGELIGRAYQAADDVGDVVLEESASGKTNQRDALFGRPSLVASVGLDAARKAVVETLSAARDQIPRCPGRDELDQWFGLFEARLRKLIAR